MENEIQKYNNRGPNHIFQTTEKWNFKSSTVQMRMTGCWHPTRNERDQRDSVCKVVMNHLCDDVRTLHLNQKRTEREIPHIFPLDCITVFSLLWIVHCVQFTVTCQFPHMKKIHGSVLVIGRLIDWSETISQLLICNTIDCLIWNEIRIQFLLLAYSFNEVILTKQGA